jgi:VanZ family protein
VNPPKRVKNSCALFPAEPNKYSPMYTAGNMPRMIERVLACAAPLAWMFVIHLASGVTGPELPDAPFPFFDKVMHFMVYGLLSFLIFRAAYAMEKWQPWICVFMAVVLTTVYGTWDEVRQASVDGRFSDRWDLLVDFTGSCMVIVLPCLIRHKPEWYQWVK